MNLLLDTSVLIRALQEPEQLRASTRRMLEDSSMMKSFSVVSLWEIAVKSARGLPHFHIPADTLRSSLLRAGLRELNVTAAHVLYVSQLPALHNDPFDRLLMCQAAIEGLTLLTTDRQLLAYPQATHRA